MEWLWRELSNRDQVLQVLQAFNWAYLKSFMSIILRMHFPKSKWNWLDGHISKKILISIGTFLLLLLLFLQQCKTSVVEQDTIMPETQNKKMVYE